MKSFIRNLSVPAEVGLVLFIGFGFLIADSIWMVAKLGHVEISNAGCVVSAVSEAVFLAAVLWIGKMRGWSLATFGSRISWRDTGRGILLLFAKGLVVWGCLAIIRRVYPDGIAADRVTMAGVTLPFILLVSVINPVFEEVLEAGYIIQSLQRFGMWPAVLASALFRASFHWWMGMGAISIFASGVIVGLAYWRWRQLWPLIVAHALGDFFALFQAIHHAAFP